MQLIRFKKYEVKDGNSHTETHILLQLHTANYLLRILVAQLVKKFHACYGTRKLITYSQDSYTGHYPEPDESSLHSADEFNLQPDILFTWRWLYSGMLRRVVW
jgi:hypothetical protein